MRRGFSILLAILVVAGTTSPVLSNAKTIEELRDELKGKRDSLKATEDRIKAFQSEIQEKKHQARTLADQIELIDDSVEEMELDITKTEQEIEKTQVEVESVEEEIRLKEEEIAHQKEILSEYIRQLYRLDQQSTVTVLLKYQTFSEAMNEAATIQELQNRAQQTLVTIQSLHEELVTKKRELEDFKQSLEALHTRQQRQQDILATQRESKQRILSLTNQQEAQYHNLLQEAQQAHQEAEASIKELDSKIREELKRQGIGNLPSIGTLDWPIEPIFGISCGFHCAGYPYEYLIGPHSAIDIPTHVGTSIKAPADGYVARTHDSGGPGYSYILIIHGDNISTVYGHVSGFAVNEGQLITRGTVIGYTGGAAGSRGSGLSSGPHLHFEVRQNNVPVNPMNFLN
ncbi:MAG: peptidoglycan DD-metalloendopeptidase family protein [Candidatus Andersenbacteria bacterium]|nr:peptidoglycan DD-metalloendopeptidase family protein [Candidatus Andersenbacteria bacterium]MBI3250423.1 peptidoglycan DD-metalloendopeptidase family protein [Candidatus Andersenbacteria bacterium]